MRKPSTKKMEFAEAEGERGGEENVAAVVSNAHRYPSDCFLPVFLQFFSLLFLHFYSLFIVHFLFFKTTKE